MPTAVMDQVVIRDARDLQQRGLMNISANGKMSFLSSFMYSKTLSPLGNDFNRETPPRMIEIPTLLHSHATLQYAGFNEKTAIFLWQSWLKASRHPQTSHPFEEIPTMYLKTMNVDAKDGTDDWDAVLRHFGISEELLGAIMAPEYAALRSTASAKYWVRDTFATRFRGLKAMQSASVAREKMLIAAVAKESALRREEQEAHDRNESEAIVPSAGEPSIPSTGELSIPSTGESSIPSTREPSIPSIRVSGIPRLQVDLGEQFGANSQDYAQDNVDRVDWAHTRSSKTEEVLRKASVALKSFVQ